MIYTFYRQEDMRIVEDCCAEEESDMLFHIGVLFRQIQPRRLIV
jgi:hypothetical protein